MPIIFHSKTEMTLTQILLKGTTHTEKKYLFQIFFLHLFFCAENAQKNRICSNHKSKLHAEHSTMSGRIDFLLWILFKERKTVRD